MSEIFIYRILEIDYLPRFLEITENPPSDFGGGRAYDSGFRCPELENNYTNKRALFSTVQQLFSTVRAVSISVDHRPLFHHD